MLNLIHSKNNKLNTILLVNDHHCRSGIGKYIFSLYDELRQMPSEKYSYHLLLQNVPLKKSLQDWAGPNSSNHSLNDSNIIVQHRPSWAKQSGFGKIFQLTSLYYFPRRIPEGFSLYHISSQMMGNSAKYISPAVVTCHDLISIVLKSNQPKLAQYLRAKQIPGIRKAVVLIFISEFTKNNFLSLFDYKEENTTVIPHGVNEIFQPGDKISSRSSLGLPLDRPIILHVGSEEPRKNIKTLLYIIQKLKKQFPTILLVRIGAQSARSQRLIKKLCLEENVCYFQNQSESALAKFYNATDVFVFPSLFEGFGLPVLEALKSGCPVVASNAASLPEITGDAIKLLDPEDVDGFAQAVETILSNPTFQSQLVATGLERSKQFSWKKTAEKTLDVYRKVLEIL